MDHIFEQGTFIQTCRRAAAEGAVLLRNEKETLPIKKGETVSVFGRIQKDYYKSGTGSGGSVNVPYQTNLLDSLRGCDEIVVNEELARLYESWIEENPFDGGDGTWASEPWKQKEMPLTEEVVKKAAEQSDKALVVIGRTAGESKDYILEQGSLLLDPAEQGMLNLVTEYFTRTAVILNTSSILDMSFLDEEYKNSITSVLYVWQGGQEGGNAAADLLTGKVTPCGKLADTIAVDMEEYPSNDNFGGSEENIYQEDVYVGYRFFETFARDKVRFPFGYGLSYTDFAIKVLGGCVDGENVRVKVQVRNTGARYAGREVVQVYYSAPQGALGRPARELAAFAKTQLLSPGACENLTLSFPLAEMAAYDDGGYTGNKSCYVLEKGMYRIYAGNDIRQTQPVKVDGNDGIYIEETVVTSSLQEACAPEKAFVRLKPGSQKEDGTYEMVGQEVPVKTIDMEKRIREALPDELASPKKESFKLWDVLKKRCSLEEFVAQLTPQELATLIRGEGMCSPRVTPGVASCFGGVSDALTDFYGIPAAAASDGPSGIRMDVGTQATQIPIGTLLSCTFDTALVEELYRLEGEELYKNRIDTILGPGMNIHRNPQNGRNFEYFSEDPLLTGKIASSCLKGLKRGGADGTIKHFACNNQEYERSMVNSVVSERALREIYLKGFQIAVTEGEAQSVMTSYNPVNGHWSASNYDLNTTILRKEWGFDGIVMTDWWSTMNDCVNGGEACDQNTAAMARAQNDLYMVVDNLEAEHNPTRDNTLEALDNGALTLGELQRNAMNICRYLLHTQALQRLMNPMESLLRIDALADTGAGKPEEESFAEGVPGRILISEEGCGRIWISREGVYEIKACIKSDSADTRAQAASVVKLNGEYAVTLQLNGTNGIYTQRKAGKAILGRGVYEVEITDTKLAGIQTKWLEFDRVE